MQISIRKTSILSLPAHPELIRKHWEELARNKDKISLNPDWDKFKLLEDAGVLITIGVFDGETLVGYSVNIINQHLHYKEDIYFNVDLVYLHPLYRKGGVGVKLLKETEKTARELGASVIVHRSKKHSYKLGQILKRMNYAEVETVLTKYLKE